MEERLRKQLDFALEIDKEKNIFRQTHLSGHGRNENDAEHAWHMAIMAWLLREYANEEVDVAKVMLMCLIHDIVEIDAGDTYAYDEENLKTQKAREDAAKERIFSLLPEDQKAELVALFDEFEAYETAEAKFAHSMDNLQPLLLNNSNDGGRRRIRTAAQDPDRLGEALRGDGSNHPGSYPKGQYPGLICREREIETEKPHGPSGDSSVRSMGLFSGEGSTAQPIPFFFLYQR